MAVPSNRARRLEANKVRDRSVHCVLHANGCTNRRKVKEASPRSIGEGGDEMVMTGSMAKYTKGSLLLIDDRPIRYAMSNIYEIGATWPKPYDRVVIGKNGPYVLACFRAEGEDASWWYMPHDEYLFLVEGDVRVDYIEPRDP